MRLVTFKELKELFGIPYRPQTILKKQKARQFPLRVKQGNLNFWRYDEVAEWVKNLQSPTPTRLPDGE